ncbi:MULTISPECIES: restriction endonuclease subunit S [unclassified Bradyrhizobium]|uniref:restriction endonuclease subunit S n=1 Tax=unclassified Bradyrhizobium TaxID=2631580 RepID=UPI00291695D3|nr:MULTISPECIES: restriction endonuclease subunit S [unclassified Bradyrhizobium]
MSFPSYSKYKESGIPFLGTVPDHWRVLPLKSSAKVHLSNVDKHSVEGEEEVSLCNYLDVYRNERITSAIEFMRATASPEQIARLTLARGDCIITKDSEDPRDIGISAYVQEDLPSVVCGYHLALIRPERGNVLGAFLAHLFRSSFAKTTFEVQSRGLTRYALGKYAIDNFRFALPSLSEQTTICAFLDRETAKIDDLVAEQRRLIELLQEKRQAVISHAVTKGLDLAAPMKHSGVEWLGEIPAHWKICRVRNLFRFVKRQEAASLPVLSVYRDFGVINKASRDDNINKTPEDLSLYQTVRPNDLVINKMKSWQGSLGISLLLGITSPDYAVFQPEHSEHSAYLNELLRCRLLPGVYRTISNGIRPDQWRLEPDKFLNLELPLPPLDEQKSIARFLQEERSKSDELEATAAMAITLLQERRSALISAAVTGKIDVRNIATAAAEAA